MFSSPGNWKAFSRSISLSLVAVAALCLSTSARAQNHGGGPGGPGGGMGGANFNSSTGRNLVAPNSSKEENQPNMHGPLQIGPPGRWWDDAKFARSLGLDANQQHRMDDVFNATKGNLRSLYDGLLHEESQLERLTRVRNPDEGQIDQQIDRVTSARNVLEKATAHAMLELRKQLTQDQIGRLEDHPAS